MARSEPATEQCNAVATWDVGERCSYTPPVNEESHGLPTDVNIHVLALELEGGELTGLWMFARPPDGDVFRSVNKTFADSLPCY